jgi:hypothetical protein
MGVYWFSTGQLVAEQTTRYAKDVILAKLITANEDSYYEELALAA